MQYILLPGLWILFGLTHSAFAATRVKKYFQKVLKSNFYYYPFYYSLFAGLLFCFILWYNFSMQSFLLWRTNFWVQLVAVLLGSFGLLIMIICAKKYFLQLSGIHVLLKREIKDELQTGGLNKYVRHPLYTGTIIFVWSVFLFIPLLSFAISAICITLYTLIGIYFEEKKLLGKFGDTYKTYAAQVPCLIPGVRRF